MSRYAGNRGRGDVRGQAGLLRWAIIAIAVMLAAAGCLSDGDEPPARPTPETILEAASPTPEAPQAEEIEPVDLIAYVGPDSNIYTVRPDGTDQQRLSIPLSGESAALMGGGSAALMIFNWPTWSPDATRIAYSGFPAEENPVGVLYVVDVEVGLPRKLFENPPEAAGRFVASRSPHYIYWSPDSKRIGFLAPSGESLSLFVIDADGSRTARVVAPGAPSYLSWSPDGRYILHHLGRTLHLVDTYGDISATQISEGSSAFRAPSWAPDGRHIAFVDSQDGDESLKVSDINGGDSVEIAAVQRLGVFSWSPTANDLAYTEVIEGSDAGGLLYSGLTVFDAGTSTTHKITDDEVVAFFWSPDGEKIAYTAIDRVTNSLVWKVTDSRGANSRRLANFIPSREMLFVFFGYFDQYAYSNSLWSPDSKSLVYTGRMAGSNGTGLDSVWVLPVDGTSAASAVAEGSLAFWSPR